MYVSLHWIPRRLPYVNARGVPTQETHFSRLQSQWCINVDKAFLRPLFLSDNSMNNNVFSFVALFVTGLFMMCAASPVSLGSELLNPSQHDAYDGSQGLLSTSREVPWYEDSRLDPILGGRQAKPRPPRPSLTLPQTRSVSSQVSEHTGTSGSVTLSDSTTFQSPSFLSCDTDSSNSESEDGLSEYRYELDIPLLDRVASLENGPIADSKTLLSPIAFTPPLKAGDSSVYTPESSHVQTPRFFQHHEGIPKYVFYPPKNPSEKSCLTSDCHRKVPRRQLSYGQRFCTPKPQSSHKTLPFKDPRWKTSQSIESDEHISCLNSNPNGSALRLWNSEPVRREPKSWFGSAEEERIEKAVSDVGSSFEKLHSQLIARKAHDHSDFEPFQASTDLDSSTACL